MYFLLVSSLYFFCLWAPSHQQNPGLSLSDLLERQISSAGLFQAAENKTVSPTKERTIYGEQALPGQFPFLVAISINTNNSRYFKPGTLLNHRWVVTSMRPEEMTEQIYSYTICLGSNVLNSSDNETVTLQSDVFLRHPLYNPIKKANDLQLIKLPYSVDFTANIRPIDLLSIEEPQPYATGLVAAGWGSIDHESVSNDLLYVNLVASGKGQCRAGTISDTTFCSYSIKNESNCGIDVGAPLISYKNAPHTTLVGIAVYSGCDTNMASVFTKLNLYVDWINRVVA